MPLRVASIAAIAGPIPSFVTFAILLTVFTNGIFLINFLWSLATTLEWSVPSPPPAEDFGLSDPVVYRGAYEFSVPDVAEDFVPQRRLPRDSRRDSQGAHLAKGAGGQGSPVQKIESGE